VNKDIGMEKFVYERRPCHGQIRLWKVDRCRQIRQ